MLGEGGTALSKLEADLASFRVATTGASIPNAYERSSTRSSASLRLRSKTRSSRAITSWMAPHQWSPGSAGRAGCRSVTSAADRLCVGTQLESLPKVAAALSSGEIGYQSASLLCHLREHWARRRTS